MICVPGGPGRAGEYLGDLGGLDEHRQLLVLDNRGTGDADASSDPSSYHAVRLVDGQAERDLRPSKTQQRISGRLTTEQRTTDRYRIRGYLSTAAKHGYNMIDALRDAILGRALDATRPRTSLTPESTPITSARTHGHGPFSAPSRSRTARQSR